MEVNFFYIGSFVAVCEEYNIFFKKCLNYTLFPKRLIFFKCSHVLFKLLSSVHFLVYFTDQHC